MKAPSFPEITTIDCLPFVILIWFKQISANGKRKNGGDISPGDMMYSFLPEDSEGRVGEGREKSNKDNYPCSSPSSAPTMSSALSFSLDLEGPRHLCFSACVCFDSCWVSDEAPRSQFSIAKKKKIGRILFKWVFFGFFDKKIQQKATNKKKSIDLPTSHNPLQLLDIWQLFFYIFENLV